ncbi:hypothetical protein [Alkaliphilus peptidifermentans]|uniref:Uncharacterized protein n=1 Tax=Alkaliphilus peptidifermentans DSM 18978 TaxID=1120976 RepID=A0A1G5KTB4_9FIRM|nr:hypothetical protein [Alkaliphilus peptidifermentans]SCZ03340.1 hypothetical protein SAMN03080606_03729 [Alkaliphilus peptidifermentans DSM 18978]
MEAIIIVVLILLNIPIFKFLFNGFFPNREDFNEAVRYTFTPDIISLFRGEYWKDRLAQMKLSFFIITCIAVISMEFAIVKSIIEFFMN